MNPNDLSDRILSQARELQNTVTKAVSQSSEQMKPLIQQSLNHAQALQKTLSEHAKESAALNQEYANKALGHISELMKIGAEALRANAEQARTMTQAMMDHARKTTEDAKSATAPGSETH
jgi:hypothetical protein